VTNLDREGKIGGDPCNNQQRIKAEKPELGRTGKKRHRKPPKLKLDEKRQGVTEGKARKVIKEEGIPEYRENRGKFQNPKKLSTRGGPQGKLKNVQTSGRVPGLGKPTDQGGTEQQNACGEALGA